MRLPDILKSWNLNWATHLNRKVSCLKSLPENSQHTGAAVVGWNCHDGWLDHFHELDFRFQCLGGRISNRLVSPIASEVIESNTCKSPCTSSEANIKRIATTTINNPSPRIGATFIQVGVFLIVISSRSIYARNSITRIKVLNFPAVFPSRSVRPRWRDLQS